MSRGALKWEQVFKSLEKQIQGGQLCGKLPSFQKLCAEYGTSLITISRVVKELERRGYVRVKPRSGVFIETAVVPDAQAPTRLAYPVKRIAFVVPVPLSEPYWSHVADGILYACEQRNREGRTRWRLEISHNVPLHSGFVVRTDDLSEHNTERRQRLEELEKRVVLELADEADALMLVPHVAFNPDFYLALLRRGVRLIIFDKKVPGVPYVASNDRRAAYKGLIFLLLGIDSNKGRYLLRQGSQSAEKTPAHLMARAPRVYVLSQADEFNTIRERIRGCQEAISDATARGYQAPPNWLRVLPRVENLNDYENEAHRETHALLDELERSGQLGGTQLGFPQKTRPIAIFTVTDRCALGAHRALTERSYCDWTNPDKESVALLSYDNVWQNLEAYSISSLAQDPFALGKTAAQILFDMPHPATFLQPGNEPADVLLDVGLIQRASTHNIKTLE